MKSTPQIFISIFTLIFICLSCKNNEQASNDLINIKDVSPWCIIGFDTEDRSPQERIDLLKELGLSNYGFNKGKGDFSTMKEEFQLSAENNIEIKSIFLWLNADRDTIGQLSESNQLILSNLKEIKEKPTIWLSFSNNFFEDIGREESIELSLEMIKYVKTLANEVGCEMAIYNHRGWFGNPHNQIEILEKLNDKSLSMVYNFHHAHEYVDEFDQVAKKITPYLSYVNLNGIKKEGPEIMTIGEGDYELKMVRALMNEGYEGPWGILGHIKTEDVRDVLNRNLDGLEKLNSELRASRNQ